MSRAGKGRRVLRLKARPGYTLLEVLIVVAIIALLATAYTAFSPSSVSRSELRQMAQQIALSIRVAQADARRGGPVVMSFDRRSWSLAGQPPQLLTKDVEFVLGDDGKAAVHEVILYPDGSVTGGDIELRHAGTSIRIQVDLLSGRLRMVEG